MNAEEYARYDNARIRCEQLERLLRQVRDLLGAWAIRSDLDMTQVLTALDLLDSAGLLDSVQPTREEQN